jgi:hypothetical protein
LILTLSITILVEGIIALGYSLWSQKPARPILFTSICGNLITQSLLWIALTIFFRRYLPALIVTELLIWIIESVLFYAVPANRLRFTDSLLLSLGMNLLSFGLGWLLPV